MLNSNTTCWFFSLCHSLPHFYSFQGQFQRVLHGCILWLLQWAEICGCCEERECSFFFLAAHNKSLPVCRHRTKCPLLFFFLFSLTRVETFEKNLKRGVDRETSKHGIIWWYMTSFTSRHSSWTWSQPRANGIRRALKHRSCSKRGKEPTYY